MGADFFAKIHKVTMKETFLEPTIRKAAWIGCTLLAIQQLTGVNAFIFYSNYMFKENKTITVQQQSAILMFINFVASVFAVFLLRVFGRKFLLST